MEHTYLPWKSIKKIFQWTLYPFVFLYHESDNICYKVEQAYYEAIRHYHILDHSKIWLYPFVFLYHEGYNICYKVEQSYYEAIRHYHILDHSKIWLCLSTLLVSPPHSY